MDRYEIPCQSGRCGTSMAGAGDENQDGGGEEHALNSGRERPGANNHRVRSLLASALSPY